MSGDTPETPAFREDEISQIPALQLLQNLGWSYLTEAEALELRGGRTARVMLTGILAPKLRELNKIRFRGETHEFAEGNIQSAIQALEDVPYDGLVRSNERIYSLLRLPKSLTQVVAGDTRSFDLRYIDWEHPERNAFHVTEEFEVERTSSTRTCRPDLVLFVNGIPVGIIECKRPDEAEALAQAISQQIRNQKDEYIPRLFLYSQLLLALSKDEARYATTGTPKSFWAGWREEDLDDKTVREAVNRPLPDPEKNRMFSGRFRYVRRHFDALEQDGREVTEQDRAIYSLCRPERLLELVRRFIVFDGPEKKIARHQQYFCVKKAMAQLTRRDSEGRRRGGVVWHTQGSGKSLTMVMLATAIAEEIETAGPKKVVLVTDRVDLDDQIRDTFRNCGLEPEQARTGKHLVELLGEDKPVINTVIDKFEAAVGTRGARFESPDIFVLVDESHRGQYGPLHARMRKALPMACLLGFTGTPVMKDDRNTINRFGGLIDTYTIAQAVRDKAVVPLLYEGRHVDQPVDRAQMDRWFERITATLSKEERADLKRKFSTTGQLNKAEQRVATIAWDVATHFADTWQGTGFKGQLVTPDKATALLYKKYLDETGLVTSEVLISAPDDREGDSDILEENKQEVVAFWRRMMTRYPNEKEYNRQMIAAFKHGPEPEIIIVVDKLLTGFDAPKNTVLYLARPLKEHTLLQAIARVNRVYEGKDFGYIVDYCGVLGDLDAALDLYGKLPDFDPKDLEGTITDISAEVAKLPQRHSDTWDLFKAIRNKRDQEAYERLLADGDLRAEFYDRLSAFGKTLAVALSTVSFLESTAEATVSKYREDLKFFTALRGAVRRRYAEVVDFKDYEPRIKKLLDRHVGAGEVETLTPLVNIFDAQAFAQEVERLGTSASKADTIAYRTKKTITERMAEDPAYYEKFSRLLEDAIAAFRAQRISDAEYLRRVTEINGSVRERTGDDAPESVRYSGDVRALYGVVRERIVPPTGNGPAADAVGAEAALAIDRLIEERAVVNWTRNEDVQNRMRQAIEDELFDLKARHDLSLSLEDMDAVMERCLDVARVRKAR